MGLDRPVDLVTGPSNMLGIELNEYAAELARVTVWIGEIQWRMDHGYPPKDNPVLEPLDFIEHRDALLVRHPVRPELVEGQAFTYTEAEWPKVSVVIGNPPFLGGSKKRGELGDEYFEALKTVFKDRVPGFGDLVCYWFAKALKAIETQGLGAAGFVSTNSIRGGANRKVLDAIVEKSHIFEAWSDEGWVNDGASVRVSLICFGHVDRAILNGNAVGLIHSDLTGAQGDHAATDLSNVLQIHANANAVFEGLRKDGPLDISGEKARSWLRLPNPNGQSNARVLFPLINGMDVTRRPRDGWVIDTGEAMTQEDAALFEAPFLHILQFVKPIREKNNDRIRRTFWWRFGRNGEQLRAGLLNIPRYINTARVAKHRLFVWQSMPSIPDTATVAITRADDTTFGILHSRFHELWSLRMCTWLGVGNDPRYTPTTCFETFPFPQGLTPLDTAHQRTEEIDGGALIPAGLNTAISEKNQPMAGMNTAQSAIKNRVNAASLRELAATIALAAQRLNALRENWLNPPEWTQRQSEITPLGMASSPYPDRILPKDKLSEQDLKELNKRTLTNLYNQKAEGKAQWLQSAHEQLDQAVAAAYGWVDYSPTMPDEEILKRLLALNLARAR
jgi:hypothetical protein